MRVADVAELIDLRRPVLHPVERRLSRLHAVADFERVALRRLPRPVAGYLAGGADREISLRRDAHAFVDVEWVPRLGRLVSEAHTDTTLLGRQWAAPIGFSPTGYTRMFSARGETAVAEAAAALGIPYVLSTMATTSVAQLRHSGLNVADIWFQLYALKSRDLTARLLDQVQTSGVQVLEVAVDAPVAGNRLRDLRTGLTIPPRLTPGTLFDIGLRPEYWVSMLRNPKMGFASFEHLGAGLEPGSIAKINEQFDPDVTWETLRWIRSRWSGKMLVKGLFGPDDARAAEAVGVDGVHLSTHGGRQLDQGCSPIKLLPEVRAALGDATAVIVDSGVRTGADVAAALALGADAAFIGRPYLWGLVVGESKGVKQVGDILRNELLRTMKLLGTSTVTQLRTDDVLRRSRVEPHDG